MLWIGRLLSASFQDAFDSIAPKPALKSGAVVLDAFSIPVVVILGEMIVIRSAIALREIGMWDE